MSQRDKLKHRSSIQPHPLPTTAEKLYMGVAAGGSLIVTAIAFSVFGLVEANVTQQDAKTRTVPVYLAIFILAQIFSCLYSFDALRARNVVQLILHIVFELCMLTYAILEIPQTRNTFQGIDLPDLCTVTSSGEYDCLGPGSLYSTLQKLMIVPPIVIGLSIFAFAALARRLYIQFGWAVFYLVGASPQLKRMHREYQTLVSLLKLAAFFGSAFCIAYLILVTSESQNKAEFIITIIALPLALLAMLVCGMALRKENKIAMITCLFLMVAGIAYFIYKLASMWLPRTASLYTDTKITMAVFSIFAILILMATFANGCVCISNFGKGLVQTHLDPANKTSLWSLPIPVLPITKEQQTFEQPEEDVTPQRLVIE